ncbi:MAG: hypothetical protein HC869_25030 [Rhodospirillales bacterium]|nr:hypothetical protein [Rhodospirillales bacterium]
MTIPECRYCKSRLDAPLVDLGEQPLANALVTCGQERQEQRFPLVVRVCPSCHLVQADHTIPKGVIFDLGSLKSPLRAGLPGGLRKPLAVW